MGAFGTVRVLTQSDTRFTGPSMSPLSDSAVYDPQGAAISSAYVSAFNAYAHSLLH